MKKKMPPHVDNTTKCAGCHKIFDASERMKGARYCSKICRDRYAQRRNYYAHKEQRKAYAVAYYRRRILAMKEPLPYVDTACLPVNE